MLARDLADFLDGADPRDEVCVEVAFPELGGWVVGSYSYVAGRTEEGPPSLRVEVWGADFDYPSPEAELRRLARWLLFEHPEQ